MKLQLDLSKEYGLVLEGGGAKGAYQIGAWKALKEEGVKFKGLSGVSVGALNGAMICMDDLDKAEEVWENISYSQVMDINEEQIDLITRRDLKNINLNDVVQDALKLVRDRGVDITPLKNMIADLCDETVIRNSDMDFYIVTYSLSDRQLIDINAKDVPEGLIPDMLLASAYLPVFKREKLHGKHYMDGGGWDRVPVDSLISRGYEDIIVLRIFGWGVEKPVKIPDYVRMIDIAPRQDLGGILEFDSARSRKNMQLGYYDAKRVLYGLLGEEYYLDMELTEDEAYERLLPMARQYIRQEEARMQQEAAKKAEQEAQKKAEKDARKKGEREASELLAENSTEDKKAEDKTATEKTPAEKWIEERLEARIEKTLEKLTERKTELRQIHEDILPNLAKKLLKNRSWTYAELYIKLLEQTAQVLEIPCFSVYTEGQMLDLIGEKMKGCREQQMELPEYAAFFL